jgi:O-antigen ligase
MLFNLLAVLWPFSLLLLTFIAPIFQLTSRPFHSVEAGFYTLYFLTFGLLGGLFKQANLVLEAAQAIVLAAAVTCFFYAAMTITVYVFAITDDFSRLVQIIPWGFVNIRYWSHVATLILPLLPLGLLTVPWRENRLWHLGVAFTAAVWWWVVFMSSSRGSMVGLLVGFCLVWICFGKIALPWMKLFIRFAIYGLAVWLLLSVLIPSMVFDELHIRGIKAHSSGRMPLWQEAWAMSLKNFPFGMGSQSWLTHDILTEAYQSSPKFGHPHNMYLMWAAEYGWISIVGLLVLGSVAFRRLWRRAAVIRAGDNYSILFLVAFTASVTAAMAHAGVSAVFIAPGSMLIGLVVLSVFWALISPDLKPVVSNQKRFSFPAIAGFLVVIAFTLAGSLWFREVLRYNQAMVEDFVYYQENVPQGMLPRFWLHGNFPRHPSQMPSGN